MATFHAGPSTPGPSTSSSADPAVFPQVQNVVSTVNLGCKLDLLKIATGAKNTEYNPHSFSAVIMRIRQPRTTALIFGSGKLVCTGATSEEDSKIAARKHARIVQKIGFPVKLCKFKIQNMVANVDVKFSLRLKPLAKIHKNCISYEQELSSGLTFRMIQPKVVLNLFSSGKVVFIGAKSKEEIDEAFKNIYPILQSFKKE